MGNNCFHPAPDVGSGDVLSQMDSNNEEVEVSFVLGLTRILV